MKNRQEDRYVFFDQEDWDAFMNAPRGSKPKGAKILRDPQFAQTSVYIKFGGFSYLILQEDGICLLVDEESRRELTEHDVIVINTARNAPLQFVSKVELVYILIAYFRAKARDKEVSAIREMRSHALYHFQYQPVLDFCKAAYEYSIPEVFARGIDWFLNKYESEH